MQSSRDRIITSHAGSLPRPDSLIAANQVRQSGAIDEAEFQQQLQAAVADVARRQRDLGVDVPGDGEYGKSMGHRVNLRRMVALFIQPAWRARSEWSWSV